MLGSGAGLCVVLDAGAERGGCDVERRVGRREERREDSGARWGVAVGSGGFVEVEEDVRWRVS